MPVIPALGKGRQKGPQAKWLNQGCPDPREKPKPIDTQIDTCAHAQTHTCALVCTQEKETNKSVLAPQITTVSKYLCVKKKLNIKI
ncbi:mCG61611 [Mus musculus]|jgi:hypothetical protein|nr:mCG61611 [Mus musculus]